MRSSPPPAEPPAGGGPPRPRPRERERRRRRGGFVVFLLASALPLGAGTWFFLQPAEKRKRFLEQLPPGAGGRAISAAVALGALVLLARVALPAFHGASGRTAAFRDRLRARRGLARAVTFPVEAVVSLAWLALQVLFAVDAFLIVVAGLVLILLAARIVKPDLLPGVLPELAR